MASESVFEKKLTAETKMDKVEGLLEHLNLPPKAIDFIRGNRLIIQIGISILVVGVVFFSLYGSYRDQIRDEASTALSLAIQSEQSDQGKGLKEVTSQYGGTSSALWASVELAHLDMKNGSFSEASEKYRKILVELKDSSPMYPLLMTSLAQSLEAAKEYDAAFGQYDLLKELKGYERFAYEGMGRLEEAQGNSEKAIAIYNNYLLAMEDDPAFAQLQAAMNAKIARLKMGQ